MKPLQLLLSFLLLMLPAAFRPARAEVMEEPSRIMDFADGLFERGVYDLAAREYARLLEQFPDYDKAPLARFRLGECSFLRGEYEAAIPHYRKVLEDRKGGEVVPAAALRLGSALYFLARYDEARRVLEPLLEREAKDYFGCGACYFLGRIAAAEGDAAKAAALLERACSEGDYRAPAAYSRAKLAEERGELDTAERYYRSALKLSAGTPLNDYAALALARLLARRGKRKDAAEMLRPLAARGTSFPACDAALSLAAVLMEEGRAREAAKVVAMALDRFPSSPLRGKLYLAAGRAAAACFEHEKAERMFEAAFRSLESPADRAAALRGRLRALFEMKRYAAAAALADEVEPLPRGDYESWSIIAECLEKAGEREKALKVYDALAASGPEPLLRFCRFRRALLLAELDRKDALVEAARKFAAEYPESREAAVLLCRAGDCAAKHEDYTLAAGLFAEAVASTEDREVAAYARYRRAVALHFLGKADEAARILRPLADRPEARPFLDGVLMLLGDYERNREDYARAAAYYARVADEFPDSPKAVTARARLAACYYARGLYDRAADEYHALVKDGRASALDDEVILWAALRLRERGRFEKALGLCKAAAAQRKGDAALVEELAFIEATVLEAKGDHERAAAAYRDFLADYPASHRRHGARLGLARCLGARGETTEARRMLVSLAAETVGELRSMALLELGRLEKKSGEMESALKRFLMVAILEDDEKLAAPALLGAAECALALGRRKEAMKHAAELVKRFPRSPLRAQAEKLLERARRPALRTP